MSETSSTARWVGSPGGPGQRGGRRGSPVSEPAATTTLDPPLPTKLKADCPQATVKDLIGRTPVPEDVDQAVSLGDPEHSKLPLLTQAPANSCCPPKLGLGSLPPHTPWEGQGHALSLCFLLPDAHCRDEESLQGEGTPGDFLGTLELAPPATHLLGTLPVRPQPMGAPSDPTNKS